ncbi:hypothetical protein NE848_05165 [Gramella jeungdoensis]|uniref:Thymidylate kinase-like domain-containing protein n=1 Tax=Gramella jeungdoensis TaxID=708091 RepID=A0ABT0YZ50_9FLAO|nr:hypothetical protein [Gramella jeungdoensis]MCM8568756.1 hypothetical protein [Gramella jeungdoensis]
MPNYILSNFFSELNNLGILYLVLRNYKKLPESTNGSDLDILIHEDHLMKFSDFFLSFIRTYNLELVSTIQDGKCPKFCISKNDWGLQIDLFKGSVNFGNKEIIPANVLFENTRSHEEVNVLDPKISAVLSFLKELLNNKECTEKYKNSLCEQFENESIPAEILQNFPTEFFILLNERLENLTEETCRSLYEIASQNFKRSRFTGLRSKISRLLNHPGFTIAFLGVDGAGKSTVINKITPVINMSFHNAVYYEHMRPNKFPSLAEAMGKSINFEGPVTNPHASKSSGFLGSLMRWGYYLLDYTMGYYLKIWPKKTLKSCVWIFDRYYYDYLVDPKRSRIALPKSLINFGRYLIKSPDLIVCLGTDAEIIYNRKPELSIDEINRQLGILKEFCANNNKAVWIDTGSSIDMSARETLDHILEVMSKRFKTYRFEL